MKNIIVNIAVFVILISLSACSAKVETFRWDENAICPKDEKCGAFATEGMKPQKLAVDSAVAIIETDGNGKTLEVETIHTATSDNLLSGTLKLGGNVLNGFAGNVVQADATRSAARTTGKAMVDAAKNTKPTQISVSAQGGHATGGTVGNITSTATATQSQAQSTGIGISLGAQ